MKRLEPTRESLGCTALSEICNHCLHLPHQTSKRNLCGHLHQRAAAHIHSSDKIPQADDIEVLSIASSHAGPSTSASAERDKMKTKNKIYNP